MIDNLADSESKTTKLFGALKFWKREWHDVQVWNPYFNPFQILINWLEYDWTSKHPSRRKTGNCRKLVNNGTLSSLIRTGQYFCVNGRAKNSLQEFTYPLDMWKKSIWRIRLTWSALSSEFKIMAMHLESVCFLAFLLRQEVLSLSRCTQAVWDHSHKEIDRHQTLRSDRWSETINKEVKLPEWWGKLTYNRFIPLNWGYCHKFAKVWLSQWH